MPALTRELGRWSRVGRVRVASAWCGPCRVVALAALALALLGCAGEGPQPPATGCDRCAKPSPAGFDGYTFERYQSMPEFLASAARIYGGDGKSLRQASVKFVLEGFDRAPCRRHFLDARFYRLHDEWMIFRRLRGVDVAGCPLPRLGDLATLGPLPDLRAIYDAFRARSPADFGFQGNAQTRIIDCEFYRRVIGQCFGAAVPFRIAAPTLGGGTLLYLPPDPARPLSGPLWLFTVYDDNILTLDEVIRVRERLVDGLPPEAGGQLRWLATDAHWQRPLALKLRADGHAFAPHVVLDEEAAAPGAVAGYSLGVAAGIPHKVAAGSAGAVQQAQLGPRHVALLAETPDELPPVAAILTAQPQTPQAHLNLLATARGTPNAWAPALFDDVALGQRVVAAQPVAVRVRTDAVDWIPLDDAEWQEWLARTGAVSEVQVPVAPLQGMVVAVPLDGRPRHLAHADLGRLGGKCVGMETLIAGLAGLPTLPTEPAVVAPPLALCVTVRDYAERAAGLLAQLSAVAEDERMADPRVRRLALEGLAEYAKAYAGDKAMLAWAKAFRDGLGATDPLKKIIDSGGVVALFAAAAPQPSTEQALDAAIAARFAPLHPTQALRMRSSSTVEDTASFHGAGLYESFTAWRPDATGGGGDEPGRTVAEAAGMVQGSYWRLAAFDERAHAGAPHLQGRMAALVHPRFDDAAEQWNAVALIRARWQGPIDGPRKLVVDLRLNAQLGAESVTNPTLGDPVQPEIVDVSRGADGKAAIVRLQASTRVAPGVAVVDDASCRALLRAAEAVSASWMASEALLFGELERAEGVLLDVELRRMAAGWPQRLDGALSPSRIIVKQLRPLLRRPRVAVEALGWLAPLDVLAAGRSVVRVRCAGAGLRLDLDRLQLDALDSLHGDRGTFWVGLSLVATATAGDPPPPPPIALPPPGIRRDWRSLAMGTLGWQGGALAVQVQGLSLTLAGDGAVAGQVEGQALSLGPGGMACVEVTMQQAPEDWLASLFPP